LVFCQLNIDAFVISNSWYSKVAKERGNKFSPRETRSTKKKKRTGGLLSFSPPNQAENARREKMEQEKKMQER